MMLRESKLKSRRTKNSRNKKIGIIDEKTRRGNEANQQTALSDDTQTGG